MGSRGITERQSDYGLDLLGAIVDTQLKQADFATFNVTEALEVIKADVLNEIRLGNRGCSAEELISRISTNFRRYFTHGAFLIAECLADYYRTGELTVTEYVGERCDLVDHHIKEVVVTPADLKILLDELLSVQNPEHELYQSWFEDSVREKWLAQMEPLTLLIPAPSVLAISALLMSSM